MKNWNLEISNRVEWIQNILRETKKEGIVLGLSGGKDSAAVALLSSMAAPNVLGVILPCGNVSEDAEHAQLLASVRKIETLTIDLGSVYASMVNFLNLTDEMSLSNIKPRLRMTTLYAIAQSRNYLVAGTGNYSEYMVGYFTKWGDGAYDFNPIADLTATEVFELGKQLGVPEVILKKKPSAGLWPGQTDEDELGITYKVIDRYLRKGEGDKDDVNVITAKINQSEHKRKPPLLYESVSLGRSF